ncbi:hypothetical protein [Sciscionella marina]|uniref:hypothetical protein n=1 Tax=Sciscionella marina TaxID=508770 RepID=UPI0012F663A4|nr:hypothetical protein [Sciscionella marina]
MMRKIYLAIRKQVDAGATREEIARKLGIPMDVVLAFCPKEPGRAGTARITKEQLGIITKGWRAGRPVIEIAQQAGVSLKTVRHHRPDGTGESPRRNTSGEPGSDQRRITGQQREIIKNGWLTGLRVEDIAREAGVCLRTVERYRPPTATKKRAKRLPVTKEKQQIIEDGWRGGLSAADIAHKAQVSLVSVYRYHPQNPARTSATEALENVPAQSRSRGKRGISIEQLRTITEGWHAGLPVDDIASRAQVSPATVHRHRPDGIPERKRRSTRAKPSRDRRRLTSKQEKQITEGLQNGIHPQKIAYLAKVDLTTVYRRKAKK